MPTYAFPSMNMNGALILYKPVPAGTGSKKGLPFAFSFLALNGSLTQSMDVQALITLERDDENFVTKEVRAVASERPARGSLTEYRFALFSESIADTGDK